MANPQLQTQTRTPTLILIHGAWHTPACWTPLIAQLPTNTYKVLTPSLPTTNSHPSKPDFSSDVLMIRSLVEECIELGEEVVLAVHSYAGIPGGEALEGLDKASCEARGEKGGVVRMVYVASFLVREGFQFCPTGKRGGMIDAMITDFETGQVTIDPSSAPALFYQDLSPSLAASLSEELLPQSIGCWWSTTTFAAWKHIPTTYVICTKDAPGVIDICDRLLSEAQKEDGCMIDKVIRRDVGHSPFYSQAEWLADTLREAAGEVI